MDQRPFIEKPSKALKNSYDKGLWAEQQVIQFLTNNNYEILQHRYQTPFAEIDLLIRGKQNQLVVLEVKNRSGKLNEQPVMSHVQRKRLRRTVAWLIEQGNEVELWLAYVENTGRIHFFQDVFD